MGVDSLSVIDSHTAGEPTRVIVDGGPELGSGSLEQQLATFRDSFDQIRSGVVREPRGSDVLVGALLCESPNPGCETGVIFFNNVGYLGMCGHGMIGVVETLRHLGRIRSGQCEIDTPVGPVTASLNDDGSVSIQNVSSYRKAKDVAIDVPEFGAVTGDVAWGGNWFYLVKQPLIALSFDRIAELQQIASAIRSAVNQAGYPEVDHIELFCESEDGSADSRNFVLCPGLEYDRSPCGTGTSAKIACLAADAALQPNATWVQQGILGTCFSGTFRWNDETKQAVIPTITGTAYVTAESKLLLHSDDPFRYGIGIRGIGDPSENH